MVSQLIPPAVWQRFGIDYEFVLGYQSHMFIYSIKWYIQGGAVIHRFHIPLWTGRVIWISVVIWKSQSFL